MNILRYLAFLLVTSYFFACNNTEKTGIKGNGNNGNTITVGDNNVVITDGKKSIADKVDIAGTWDTVAAKKIVYGMLNASIDSVQKDYRHEILNFYDMDYGDKQSIIAVAYSAPRHGENVDGQQTDYDCHACGGKLSFVEFGQYANGWKIENKYMQVVEDGQWGRPNTEWKLLNMGNNKFAFVVQTGSMHQGEVEEFTSIYAFIGGGFKELLNVQSGDDDSGARDPSTNNYESDFNVIKEGTGYYDLRMVTKGIKDSKQYSNTTYYKFDGIQYSASNNFR